MANGKIVMQVYFIGTSQTDGFKVVCHARRAIYDTDFFSRIIASRSIIQNMTDFWKPAG
jgi:hypothetical protein